MATSAGALDSGVVENKDQTYEVSADVVHLSRPVTQSALTTTSWVRSGMRLSRLTKILTVASAAVLLAACGGNAGDSGSSSDSPGGPVTLNWFMWSGSDVERNAWLHVADLVTQKYPNIKIQFETTP
ncbi:MAG TPA: hypothetical protein VFP01_12430, partial [Propionibacteriaceae bacterium]|nr:hypothetical protein [Propionibacteriaceae bacterium]